MIALDVNGDLAKAKCWVRDCAAAKVEIEDPKLLFYPVPRIMFPELVLGTESRRPDTRL